MLLGRGAVSWHSSVKRVEFFSELGSSLNCENEPAGAGRAAKILSGDAARPSRRLPPILDCELVQAFLTTKAHCSEAGA